MRISDISTLTLDEKKRLLKNVLIPNNKLLSGNMMPLSPSQKRIYIIHQINQHSISYNISGVYKLIGVVDRDRIEKALRVVVSRNEMLRASFHLAGGEIVQTIHEEVTIDVPIKKNMNADVEACMREFVKPFDLSRAPLLRIEIAICSNENAYLLFDMHHIVADGTSLNILLREFSQAYNGHVCLGGKHPYQDYVRWCATMLGCGMLNTQKRYWEHQLHNLIPTILPVDRYGTKEDGEIITQNIDAAMTNEIERYCVKHAVTKSIFLLAILKLAIFAETRQDDVSVGIPVSNRDKSEWEDIIGIFLNVLILRTIINPVDSFTLFLRKTKLLVTEAFDNRSYPYERIDEMLRRQTRAGRDDIVSIMYNYLPNQPEQEVCLNNLTLVPVECHTVAPKYDLTLYVSEIGSKMTLRAVYKRNKFERYKMDRLLNNIRSFIDLSIANDDIVISTMLGAVNP